MIKDLKNIKKDEVNLFGGKATNLGFLIQNGFNVPDGFCISAQINKIDGKAKREIIQKFKKFKNAVAVRSSSTMEDSRKTSFAGQFDTFLNINSEKELLKSIEKCWESVKSDRVAAYLKNKRKARLKMAVIVQKMINADFAGVIFTVDPVKKKNLLIEMAEGLGDKLVSGKIIPNSYFINKETFKIEKKNELFKIEKALIKEISKVALKIEKAFSFPQDIEFCIKNNKIFILQSRPITTL